MLTLCGCGTSPTPTIRVGVALYQQEDTFISTVAQSLQQRSLEEEQARGVKINLSVADGRGSQTQQNEQVDRFLDQKYDVICVNIVDRTAAAVIIDKAQAAGVPVIFFNRQPVEEDLSRWDGAYYVGSPGARPVSCRGRLCWMPGSRIRRRWTAAATVFCSMSCWRERRAIRTPCCAPSTVFWP